MKKGIKKALIIISICILIIGTVYGIIALNNFSPFMYNSSP